MTPILATVAIFSAVAQWNTFQDTLIYITDQSLYTLQYLLYMFINQANSLAQAAQNSGGNLGQIVRRGHDADADVDPDDGLGARRAADHLRLSPVPALLREGHHARRGQGLTRAPRAHTRKECNEAQEKGGRWRCAALAIVGLAGLVHARARRPRHAADRRVPDVVGRRRSRSTSSTASRTTWASRRAGSPKIVKDKFNMKLNIIAPNVAGGGDTLYNTRVAAGDLGDLIITDKGEKLDELIEGGLVLDARRYYPAMKNVDEVRRARSQHLNDGKRRRLRLPDARCRRSSRPSRRRASTRRSGRIVRWDLYKRARLPARSSTLEDLLPVLKDMQDARPHRRQRPARSTPSPCSRTGTAT